MMFSRSKHFVLGCFIMLLQCFLFSGMCVLSKIASNQTSISMIVFVQSGVAVCLMLPRLLYHKFQPIKSRRHGLLFMRALLGSIATFCILLAVHYIPVADANLLNHTVPFFIPIIAWLWLREKFNTKLWPALLLGFVGIAFIIQPGSELFNPASLYGLISAVLYACVIVLIRDLARTEPNSRILFYYFFYSMVIFGVIALLDWHSPSPIIWGVLILLGFLLVIQEALFNLAIYHANPQVVSILAYSAVIFSGFFDWLIWHHIPPMSFLIGFGIVLMSSVLCIMRGRFQ